MITQYWKITNLFRLTSLLITTVFVVSCGRSDVQKTQPESIHYDFTDMNAFFTEYVKDGRVNYAKVKEDNALDKIINDLKNIEPYLIEDGTERLAFWINVYNIYTIKLISDHYPVTSILDIEQTAAKSPWEINFIEMAGGRKFSLDEIEKKILIPKYNEPRIHYALVCAAQSCPELISGAYMPEGLYEQLDRQGRIFLNDRNKNYLDMKKGELYLSQIYKWYRKDFIKKDSTVINHVLKYINDKDSAYITDNDIDGISYNDYSWELNDLNEE